MFVLLLLVVVVVVVVTALLLLLLLVLPLVVFVSLDVGAAVGVPGTGVKYNKRFLFIFKNSLDFFNDFLNKSFKYKNE